MYSVKQEIEKNIKSYENRRLKGADSLFCQRDKKFLLIGHPGTRDKSASSISVPFLKDNALKL